MSGLNNHLYTLHGKCVCTNVYSFLLFILKETFDEIKRSESLHLRIVLLMKYCERIEITVANFRGLPKF